MENEEEKTWNCNLCGLTFLPTNLLSCLCGNQYNLNTKKELMFKIFTCIDLINLIKDFGGILCEYPICFLYKLAPKPRAWGFKWWFTSLEMKEQRFVVPSKRKKYFDICVPKTCVNPKTKRIMPTSSHYFIQACCFDEFQNAWPVDTYLSLPNKKLSIEKKWSRKNMHLRNQTNSETTSQFTVQSFTLTLTDLLCDEIWEEASWFLMESNEWNFELIFWYIQTFPLLKEHDHSLFKYITRDLDTFVYRGDLNYFTKAHLFWLEPTKTLTKTYLFVNRCLVYHCGLISLMDWLKEEDDPWKGVSWLFDHYLYETVRKFLRESALLMEQKEKNCSIKWYSRNNLLERAKFIYENFPGDFSNLRFDLTDANEQIIDFFIGKLKFGLQRFFLSKMILLNTIQFLLQDPGLLFRAWSFFQTHEKEIFIKKFFQIVESSHLPRFRSPDPSRFLQEEENSISIYLFIKKLLQYESKQSLFNQELDSTYKYMFEQLIVHSQENNRRESSFYLDVLISYLSYEIRYDI